MIPPLNRRDFLKSAGLASAAFAVARPWLNSSARTVSPSEKLNIAAIGFGGVGGSNVRNSADENIVALCDLDLNSKRCASTIKTQPQAALFTDFREMLEKQKDIDAVIIATPDHSHAYIAMECMRAGKHVYVQKPIAHSVFEARTLTEAARKYKVVSQMGNQGHSGEGIRQITEWIAAGLIGQVREVHAWTNRPIWPQSSEMERPKDVQSPPEGMDWNKWIGPAPSRPFNSVYHPGKWRAWCDFGTGSLGDMGCHIIDPIFMALKLRYPTSVEGNVSTVYESFGQETKSKNECYPRSSIARFKFPAREGLAPVELTWWDGGLMPSRPDELEEEDSFGDRNGGCLFIGDKAIRKLNKRFKRRDRATDVLSFGLDDVGSIAISLDTASRNAKIFGTLFHEEALRYVVHGILHLFGYDDGTGPDRRKMAAEEDRILRRLCPNTVLSKVLTRR